MDLCAFLWPFAFTRGLELYWGQCISPSGAVTSDVLMLGGVCERVSERKLARLRESELKSADRYILVINTVSWDEEIPGAVLLLLSVIRTSDVLQQNVISRFGKVRRELERTLWIAPLFSFSLFFPPASSLSPFHLLFTHVLLLIKETGNSDQIFTTQIF